jgi:hypothetical protein
MVDVLWEHRASDVRREMARGLKKMRGSERG